MELLIEVIISDFSTVKSLIFEMEKKNLKYESR